MKKLIVLSLAGLLILAFGATAYAQKLEFRASGYFDTQTFVGVNVPEFNVVTPIGLWGVGNGNFSINTGAAQTIGAPPFGTKYEAAFLGKGFAPPTGYNNIGTDWESKAALKFDAVMGPNLSGTIYLEMNDLRWGSSYFGAQGFANPWSPFNANGREAGNYGGWDTGREAVQVKNVYVDVGLPYFGVPWPITVRVGAQPIGIRPAMLLYSDGMGVTAGIKIDPVLINPIYAKAVENGDFTHLDSDVYGLQANAKIGTVQIGGYGLYYRMNTFPFFWVSSSQIPGSAFGQTIIAPGTQQSNMWWLGAYAEGKTGPVDFNFDFVYDFGEENSQMSIVPHVTYNGWASRLNVEYPWEKFKFGVTGMYASGSDTRHTDPTGMAGNSTSIGTLSKNVSGYVIPVGSVQGAIDSESIVMYDMEGGATAGYGIGSQASFQYLSRGGFGGTWFAKLYASAKLTPWYKLTAQALYIGDTSGHGDTFGTAMKPNGLLRDDQFIGVELDIMNDIQIYNNLRFWMGFGYMFAGKAMDINPDITSNGYMVPGIRLFKNSTPDNPWAFRTRLIYTF